jgi:hypothetical protein
MRELSMSCREHGEEYRLGCLSCHESKIGVPDNNIAATREEDYQEAVKATRQVRNVAQYPQQEGR